MSNGDVREKHAQQLQKTQMCKFFASGRCGKGSDCSFAHHPSEIRQRPDLNRTSMCKAFLTRGNCTNPRCAFAHDERELRATEGFFKTKLCKFADSGRCKHGKSCRFAHTQEELHAGKPKDKPVQALPQASGSRGLTVSNLTPESSPLSPISGLSDPFFGEATLPTVQTVTVLKALQALQGQLSTLSMVQAQVQAQDRALVRMGKMDSHSDQSASTRAETNTSVAGNVGANSPDRNSSGSESGEEADYEKEPVPQQDSRMRDLTTLTIFNVPDFLTQAAFISLLEDLAPVVRNAFDFFYLPWNSNQEKNLGHAIINFFSRSTAAEFANQCDSLSFAGQGDKQRLRIVPAALQGRAANLRHFSAFGLAHHEDPRFRPHVRAAPNEPLMPMDIPKELLSEASAPTWPSLPPGIDCGPMIVNH